MKNSTLIHRREVLAMPIAVIISDYAKANQQSSAKNYFMLNEEFNIDQLMLPLPPADDISEAKLVLELVNNRKPEIIKDIIRQDKNIIDEFISAQKMSTFEYKYLKERLEYALSDAAEIVDYFKKIFNRKRPNLVMPEIVPVIEVPENSAYPSGHATQAAICAHLLTELVDKSKNELFAIARNIAKNREIAGLHYPSDTESGLLLGTKLSKYFVNNFHKVGT